MAYTVALPDGRTVQFPDDVTQEKAAEILRQQFPAPAPSTERTWGEAIKDVPASLLTGAGSLLQAPGQLVKLVPGLKSVGEALEAPGEAVQKYGTDLKSTGLKAREALRSQAMSEAEKEGVLSEFATAITSTLKDPALITSFITEQVPMLLGPLGAARLTTKLGMGAVEGAAAGAAREAAAAKLGQRATTAAIGTGTAMQAADVSGDTYTNTLKRALEMGMSQQEAEDAAINAARVAAGGAAAVSLGANLGLSKLGGAAIERRLAGLPGRGRIQSGLGEATSETLEEAGGQLFQNIGVRTVDPSQSLTAGVGGAAAMGALGGGFFGSMLGKKPDADLAPGQRPGETLQDTANRLNAQIGALTEQAKEFDADQTRTQAGLMTNTQLIDMYRDQGYGAVKQYQQQLVAQASDPNVPPEQKTAARQAAQQIEDLFKQVSAEEVSRQMPSEVSYKITDKDLTRFDIKGSDPLYKAAFGKDISDPVQAQSILDAIDAELNRKGIRQTQAARLMFFKDALDRVLETLPAGGLYVPPTVQQPSGAGAGVAGVSGTDTTAAGSGAAKPSGVVPPEPNVEQPVSRKAEPTAPITEEEVTPQKAEKVWKTQPDFVLAEHPIDAEILNLRRIKDVSDRQKVDLDIEGMASDALKASGRLQEVFEEAPTPAKPAEPAAPTVAVTPALPNLPKDLALAKPRYAYGEKQFQLKFNSDIDKALYITAQKTPSKRDADYRSWLETQGFTPDQIAQGGQQVREAIKGIAKTAKPEAGPINLPVQTKKPKRSLAPEVEKKLEPIYKDLERRAKAPKQEKPAAEVTEAPKEKTQKDLVLEQRAELIKQLDGILKKILAKYNLTGVKLDLDESMADEGSYRAQVIKLALNLDNPVRVLRHESIHALKDMGFFSDAQWKTLVKKAQDEWVDKYLKNREHNATQSRYDAYVELLTKEGKSPTEVQEAIIEEAIADAFGDFDANGPTPGLMAAILKRMQNLFKAIKEAFGVAGIDTAEEIFGKIEKGSLKPAIPMGKEQAPKMSLRGVPMSTRPIMESSPLFAMNELGLKTEGVKKPGGIFLFNDVRSIANALNRDTVNNYGTIDKEDTSANARNLIAKAIADEVAYQVGTTSQTGTGLGWYSNNYPKAVKKLARKYPELGNNEHARSVFSALVAITSNGEKVSLNIKNAINLYDKLRSGEPMIAPGSRRATALDNNLQMVQDLLEKHGTNFKNVLLQEILVKDMNAALRAMGEKPSGDYLANTKVPAAAVYFGPKLGAFYANLEGAEGYLTMDMWWTRSINRMRGLLMPQATESSINKFREVAGNPNMTRDEVIASTIPLRDRYEELAWTTDLEYMVGEKEPSTKDEKPVWTARAKRKAGPAYEQLKLEHDVMKMANTIYKNEYEMLEEAPFGANDREFMYRAVREAQKMLKQDGVDLTLADIQAALWYYEKRLYQHLSGRKADDIGYDEAISAVAGESDRPAGPSVVFDQQPDRGTDTGAGVKDTDGVRRGPSEGQAKLSLRGVVAEVAPNPDIPVAASWRQMTQAERLDATRSVAKKVIDPILSDMGLKGYSFKFSSGKYEGEVNPNILIEAPESATVGELEEVARVVGYILDQKAMVAYDEYNTDSGDQAGFVKVMIPAGMDDKTVTLLRNHISKEVPQADGDTLRDGSLVYGNFSAYNDNVDTLSDEEYHDAIVRAIEDFDYSEDIEVSDPLKFHSQLVWPDNRESYLEGTRYGESEKIRGGEGSDVWRQRRSRLEAISEQAIALRDRWIDARGAARIGGRAGDSAAISTEPTAEYGKSIDGSETAVGVHFSQQPRATLDSQFYGAGLRGMERERLEGQPDIRNRIYFYVDTGKGVFPEAGVGGSPHVIRLNNLYNVLKDELDLVKKAKGDTAAERANAWEKAIKNAGFDGYFFPDPLQRQGYAVLIGKHRVETKLSLRSKSPEFKNSEQVEKKSLRAREVPKDSAKAFFKAAEKLPRSKGIEAVEEAWSGGVADFGDRDAAKYIAQMPGYSEYASELETLAWEHLAGGLYNKDRTVNQEAVDRDGRFYVYRYGDLNLVDEINEGSYEGRFEAKSTTLSINFAKAFANFAGFDEEVGINRGWMRMAVKPEAILMLGSKSSEMELVVDLGNVESGTAEVIDESFQPEAPEARFSLRSESPEFKFWFGQSKIVDKDGKPKVMYHGTGKDYTVLGTGRRQAKAIFVTDEPEFAQKFAIDTFNRAAEEAAQGVGMSEEAYKSGVARAIAAVRKDYKNLPEGKAMIEGIRKGYEQAGAEGREYMRNAFRDALPAGPNILPIYVKAEFPFDYDNKDHVNAIINKLSDTFDSNGKLKERGLSRNIFFGAWELIERPDVQAAIRELGFDSFYVKEQGRKSLAVYSPNQITSATGNVGAYGQRPITAEEAGRFGMTEEQAAEAQGRGDIRFSLRSGAQAFDQKKLDELNVPDYKSREKLVELPIKDFLALSKRVNENSAYSKEKLEQTRKYLQEGSPFTSIPFLSVNENDGQVTGHEGRHRAIALAEAGYESMPVILIMSDLRWSEQLDPNRFDYKEAWPTELKAEKGAQDQSFTTPFPVKREDSRKPYREEKRSLRSKGDPVTRENVVDTMEMAQEKQPYMNCQLCVQMATGVSKLLDLPKVKTAQIGDIYTFNERKNMASHYAVDVGDGNVAEIEGWGEEVRVVPLSEVVDEYDEPSAIRRPPDTAYTGEKFSLRSAPTTPEFKRWFGDSKFVNKDGSPKVLYHGTRGDFNTFRVGDGVFGRGVYVAEDPGRTKQYWGGYGKFSDMYGSPSGGNVMPVYVRMENPKVIKTDVLKVRYPDGSKVPSKEAAKYITDQAIAEGHDGLVSMMGDKIWEAVVFSPEQIKSATGNIGTYDPTSPDIRKSLRSTLPASAVRAMDKIAPPRYNPGFAERMMNAVSGDTFTSIRQKLINRYEALASVDRRVAKMLKQMGGAPQLAGSRAETAALMSDLGAGVLEAAMGVHNGIGGAPIYRNGVTTVSDYNGTVKGLLEIFKPIAAMKDADAFRMYQTWAAVKRGVRLDAEGREDLITAADIRSINDLRRSNPDLIKTFEAVQKDWIAYNNALVKYQVDTGVLSPEMAKEWTKHGDYFPFYRLMEGEDIAGPKVFSSIGNVSRGKKLKGGENPLGDFFENIVRNSQAAIQAGMKNIAAQTATKQALMLQEVTRLNYKPKAHENVYRVYENGREVYYRAHDPLFIEAIKALNMADIPFMGLLAKPAAMLRNLVTKDPAFMLANMMRDSLSAWATSGVKMTPVIDTLRNFGSAIAGKSPELNALYAAGVLGGYDYARGTKQSAEVFEKTLRRRSGQMTPFEVGTKPFTSVWEALEKGTQASDAATRMEVYKRTLAATGNELEALSAALEVMNFNRKGNSAIIRILTAAVPFLNARIQGLDILFRTAIMPFGGNATDQARQRMKTFWVRGMTIMALSSMYWLLTHDDDEYKKQEQETRDNYWLIPSLGIKIPIPFEVGVMFKVIPERLMQLSFGTDTSKDFTDSMKRQLVSTFAFNPIPQVVLPLYETKTNHSFFTDRPIIGKGLENVADKYQIGPSTSRVAQLLGDSVNYSPMKIDHLIKGYTGTIGSYASDLFDMMYDMGADAPKASKRFEQMPVIKRFALDPDARGTVTAYYGLKDQVDQAVRTTNLLERSNNFAENTKYTLENLRLLATDDYVKDVEKDMKDYREMKQQIMASTLSADTKRDLLLNINRMESLTTKNIQSIKKFAQ